MFAASKASGMKKTRGYNFSINVTLMLANLKFTNILATVQKASWWEILEAILAVCGPLI